MAINAATQNNAYSSANVSAGTAVNNGPFQFRYPKKRLDNTSDFLEIKVFDYVPGGFELGPPIQSQTARQRLKAKQDSPKGYILLPIPQNVSDSISVSWGEDNINAIEAAGLGIISDAMKNPIDAVGKAMEVLKSGSSEIANNQSLQTAIKNIISGSAVNTLGGNVSSTGLISRTTGSVLNSNLELLFAGVNLRTFQFTFDMAPRSRPEAEEVKQIIRTFKREMSARSGGAASGSNTNVGLFITAPSLFQLTYKSGPNKHPFLNTFKPCALTDVTVNYTASGTYATYDDGSPVHIQMGLTFKEINPVYSEDYDSEVEATTGVGY